VSSGDLEGELQKRRPNAKRRKKKKMWRGICQKKNPKLFPLFGEAMRAISFIGHVDITSSI
jgi:hypothetical protein